MDGDILGLPAGEHDHVRRTGAYGSTSFLLRWHHLYKVRGIKMRGEGTVMED